MRMKLWRKYHDRNQRLLSHVKIGWYERDLHHDKSKIEDLHESGY